jgi:hypothetical protein
VFSELSASFPSRDAAVQQFKGSKACPEFIEGFKVILKSELGYRGTELTERLFSAYLPLTATGRKFLSLENT